jgi:quercetin dioxygenase-like cupin family protein
LAEPYTVKAIETIASAPGVLVREFTLAPGEEAPWHRHSEVSDRTYGLEGEVIVERRSPDERRVLTPGDACDVAPGVLHRVVNETAAQARYLLVQRGGAYDFKTEPAAPGEA